MDIPSDLAHPDLSHRLASFIRAVDRQVVVEPHWFQLAPLTREIEEAREARETRDARDALEARVTASRQVTIAGFLLARCTALCHAPAPLSPRRLASRSSSIYVAGKVQVHHNTFIKTKFSSKSTFIKNHFHQKTLSSKTNFIKKPISSKNHFHQKPLSSKTTFIKYQFHQKPISSETTSCQWDSTTIRAKTI